jgi:hypothetical protein
MEVLLFLMQLTIPILIYKQYKINAKRKLDKVKAELRK